jgi:hypothetical protein
MAIVLWIFAIFETLGAFGTFASAKSAIHEILATLMLGFAVLTAALASILAELRKQRPNSRVELGNP